MNKAKINRLIYLVTKTHISEYIDYENVTHENQNSRKEEFISLCRSYLRMVVKEMGLNKDQYEIRVNRGGIACSGDIHLHTDKLYVDFSQSCLGPDFGFMWRSCEGKRDYTGGSNQWMRWERCTAVCCIGRLSQILH